MMHETVLSGWDELQAFYHLLPFITFDDAMMMHFASRDRGFAFDSKSALHVGIAFLKGNYNAL